LSRQTSSNESDLINYKTQELEEPYVKQAETIFRNLRTIVEGMEPANSPKLAEMARLE
jgi:hypothetical protein